MGKRSKAKGAAFERLACAQLSLWVTGGRRDDCFYRSSMSGGRATVRHRAGKKTASQAGDICAIAREGHAFLSKFIVECKHMKDLAILGALFRGQGVLANFWRVLEKEAVKHDRRPILIARQNGYPILALVYSGDACFFGAVGSRKLACLCKLGERPVEVYELTDLLRSKGYAAHRFRS